MRRTVVDLFAGAGLFSAAFADEGFDMAGAVELDAVAAATYAANLGPVILQADVSSIAPRWECDVLLAGPPCQGFSTLGKRDPLDARNTLSLCTADWARALKPEIVVVENVPGFLGSSHWRRLARRLSRLGYSVTSTVLDACDFGVAQYRSRSFTFASKKPLRGIESGTRGRKTVRHAWSRLSAHPDDSPLHQAPVPSDLALRRMKVIPPGGDKRDVIRRAPELSPPSWLRMGPQATDVWGRIHWDCPANTLRCCLQNPSKGRYIHPEQNRVITLREAARLQTIVDSWRFCGLPTQVARQIGNSVPLAVGREIAKAVRRSLG